MSTKVIPCPALATEPEGRLTAVVDVTFNLGAGRLQTLTLRRRINQQDLVQDLASAAHELRRWVFGGGKVLQGLMARRIAESDLLQRRSKDLAFSESLPIPMKAMGLGAQIFLRTM